MTLRALMESDLEMVRGWRNAPEVRRYMYTTHEIGPEEHLAWFARISKDHGQRWFVYEDERGVPAGVVNVLLPRPGHSAMWGFYAAPGSRLGTGSRMEFESLDLFFLQMSFHKLSCEVLANNAKVIKLHQKFGFVEEGRFRSECLVGNDYVDVVRLGILAKEWQARRPALAARLGLDAQIRGEALSDFGGLRGECQTCNSDKTK